jgi:hypothetical protein
MRHFPRMDIQSHNGIGVASATIHLWFSFTISF